MTGRGKHEKERPGILDKFAPVYEHEFSRIPDKIRVSFMDGTTAVYDLRTEQPAPVILENIKIIKKWNQEYVNQPARRRRSRR